MDQGRKNIWNNMENKVRVLVVSADEQSRELISSVVKQLELAVSAVLTAEEGARALSEAPHAAAFIDATCEEWGTLQRTLDPSMLVAVITANNEEEVPAEGVCEILLKPLTSVAVRGVMTRFLWNIERRAARRFTPGLLAEGEVRFELVSTHRALQPAVSSVSEILEPFLSALDLSRFTAAVYETLVNGLEHGNYGITKEERHAARSPGEFELLLHNRSLETIRKGVPLSLTIRISPNSVECSVTDRGKGFDWRRALEQAALAAQSSEELRRRGLFLMMSAFDELEFNGVGNRVTGRKKLPRTRGL
jgi:anti-sigma regulatory factor (Ser/Thr protein kinase)